MSQTQVFYRHMTTNTLLVASVWRWWRWDCSGIFLYHARFANFVFSGNIDCLFRWANKDMPQLFITWETQYSLFGLQVYPVFSSASSFLNRELFLKKSNSSDAQRNCFFLSNLITTNIWVTCYAFLCSQDELLTRHWFGSSRKGNILRPLFSYQSAISTPFFEEI